MSRFQSVVLSIAWVALVGSAHAAWIWIEGEKPFSSAMNRHPWWYDQVKREEFSGGDFISNFSPDKAGEAEYRFQAETSGEYELWVRANPLQAAMTYTVNSGKDNSIDFARGAREHVNVAADGKPDLRFLAWVDAGKVTLKQGENRIRFWMTSANSHHGYLDCFVLTSEPFEPNGKWKPNEASAHAAATASDDPGWFPFAPKPDTFDPRAAIDLRGLNETVAGEHGFIAARGPQFVRGMDGAPIRFWAVNGPPGGVDQPVELRRVARTLAKYGVNLVRLHGGMFDDAGEFSIDRIRHAQAVVAAMKAEGIYTHFSIYFPLWLSPKPGNPWLRGYKGNQHPFAALFFNPDFQAQYRKWLMALLLTPGLNGGRIIDDPAVMGLELQNEDSLFFWTFSEQNLPEEQLSLIETQFGNWLTRKYGSAALALAKWETPQLPRDQPLAGRVAFRPLWNMAHDRTLRDRDTAEFLYQTQTAFYRETIAFARKLGFRGLITPSNWTTADNRLFGPLEKMTYTAGDFIDRHGYFGCANQGEAAEWSIRDGHTYIDRSALRFDPEQPGKRRALVHPVMDPAYDDKPSMISETTWNRPNRYRSEAPLFYAAYGALQDSDAIVHFALDGANWSVKPGYFMQPWTLMAPSQMGQFPAAALIFRLGLIHTGRTLANIRLNRSDLFALKGTPMPQDASFDELRLRDVPVGTTLNPGQVVDPLIHLAGQTVVSFSDAPGNAALSDTSALIDHAAQTVASVTGELRLDYGKGTLWIAAPQAQGVSGALNIQPILSLPDMTVKSPLDLAHIVAVSLDGQPLSLSRKILLQAMSEEKPTGWATQPAGNGVNRIVSIGRDPWRVKELKGTVRFKRADASSLSVTALDYNGIPTRKIGTADNIELEPSTLYYVIEKK